MRVVLVACLVVSSVALGSLYIPAAHSQDVETVATSAKPSVAVILAKGPDGISSGTGFLVADQLVLTADHVVRGATEIVLEFPNFPPVPARLVRGDQDTDVAVLSIPTLPIPPLPLGDITQVREGQTIVVIGFPRIEALGTETASVTEGIVSAIRSDLVRPHATVVDTEHHRPCGETAHGSEDGDRVPGRTGPARQLQRQTGHHELVAGLLFAGMG